MPEYGPTRINHMTDTEGRVRFNSRPLGRALVHKTDIDTQDSVHYLMNPTKKGIWKLEATWLPDEGIIKYLLDSTRQKLKRNSAKYREPFVQSKLDRLNSNVTEMQDITFLLSLLSLLNDPESDLTDYESYYRYRSGYLIRQLNINKSYILKKYASAVQHFSRQIYMEGFSGNVGPYLSGLKNGNILVQKGPKNQYKALDDSSKLYPVKIEILALKKQPLEDLYILLELLGIAKDGNCYTIYSPEEELLKPYVEVVKSIIPKIMMPQSMARHYSKMLTDYDNESYTACITTAGLVGEEYLIQVYETLSRKACPQNLMLGKAYNLIGELAKELLNPAKIDKPRNRKDLMNQIKNRSQQEITAPKLLSIISEVLEYIDAKDTNVSMQFEKSRQLNTDYSLFPNTVKLGLENVMLYRNAASHKSTFPIDALEAQKSIFGSLSLLIWWENQKKKIDGSLSQREILIALVDSAKTYDEAPPSIV